MFFTFHNSETKRVSLMPAKWLILLIALLLFIFPNYLLLAQNANFNDVTVTLAPGTDLTNPGDLTLNTYGAIDNSGTIYLGGNWSNNSLTSGFINNSPGKVILNGSAPQSVSGTTTTTFNDVEILNSNGAYLGYDETVKGNIILSNGRINLNGKDIDLSGVILLENNTNYIYGTSGTIHKTEVLNNPSMMNIGNLGAIITSASNLGTTTITRGHAAQTGCGNQSVLRYYDISPSNNSGLNATLRFTYLDHELNGQVEDNFMLYRSTDAGLTWSTVGADHTDYINNYVEKNGINAFSRWTVNNSVANPLPVELLSFSAVCENGTVYLKWSTVSETNNDHFIIERSCDNINWEYVSTLNAAGNSNTLVEYSYADGSSCSSSANGSSLSYYRLKQVDYDGEYVYLGPVAAGCGNNDQGSFHTYINENKDLCIDFTAPEIMDISICLFDYCGKMIRKVNDLSNPGMNHKEIDLSGISSGIYILTFEHTHELQTIKITINR
jgi:hypothetical protein